MNTLELKMRQRVMQGFISADSISITLTRKTKIASGNGSWTEGSPVTLPPQKFRLVPFKRRLSKELANTQDGSIPLLDYVLVAPTGADVQRDDEFTYQGFQCKIVGVEPISTDGNRSDRVVAQFEMR